MASTTPKIDRHSILAEIKRRYGSLAALAEKVGIAGGHLTVALGRPYPKAEAAIASALDTTPQQLWPDRFFADGRRRRAEKATTTRKSQSANSRNQRKARA